MADVAVGAGIVLLALVVEGQGGDRIESEGTVIVEGGFKIPLSCLATALAVSGLRGIAVLAVAEDVLPVLVEAFPNRIIGSYGRATVLVDIIIGVV